MISDAELLRIEHDVETALRAADPSQLHLLGEGEISLVLAAGDGRWACKRLPPFPSRIAAERYAATIERYLAELARRKIAVLDTTLRHLDDRDDRSVLYCLQPVVESTSLASEVARRDPQAGPALVERIVDVVLAAVDARFGLDAQLSNWALLDDRLVYFDITTPLLCDAGGDPELDAEVFVASVPWIVRPPIRRFVSPGILRRYHDPRTVVVDLAANLLRERLDDLVPVVVAASEHRVEPPLTHREIRRDHRNDALTWGALQAVRRMDRAWQRRVRRRPYPFLLPTHRHT